MHSEMSESRFRSRISQERRTEGWKREKLKQKTTVKSVVVKIDLGGERKRRERNSRETADRRGERITNGQGSTRSRS
jgi:ribosome-binding protein aMBF1 (putative translation factor)